MERTIEDVKNELIDTIGDTADRFGLPRIAGLVKALLLFTEGPLSLDEMADRLEVSKGSISTNIRILERWKVARRVFNRKDRKNYYEIRGNIWEIETEIVQSIMTEQIEKFRALVRKCADNIAALSPKGEGEAKEKAFLTERFAEILEYIDAVDYLTGLFLREGRITPATIKKITIN